MILSHEWKFIFIKGRKVAGTSIEMALSTICGPDDIVTPITPFDEVQRIRAGGYCRNYGVDAKQEAHYRRLLAESSTQNLDGVSIPKSTYYHHMSLREVYALCDRKIQDYRVIFAERSPYSKIISFINMKGNLPNYTTSGEMLYSDSLFAKEREVFFNNGAIDYVKNIDLYRDKDGTIRSDPISYDRLHDDFRNTLSALGIKNALPLPHSKKGGLPDNRPPEAYLDRRHIEIINEIYLDEFQQFKFAMIPTERISANHQTSSSLHHLSGQTKREFVSVIAEASNLLQAHLGLAHAAERAGDWASALSRYEACLESSPNAPGALQWRAARANALEKLQRFSDAEREFASLAAEAPNLLQAHLGLAHAAERAGDWASALSRYEACLESSPNAPGALQWRAARANALEKLQRFSDAEREFASLAAEAPNLLQAHLGLAHAAERAGDWASALSRYEACLETHPNAPGVPQWRVARAHALIRLDRVAEAEAEFEALLEIPQVSMFASAGFAKAAASRGQWSLAAERWAACIQRFPAAPAAKGFRQARALALSRAGQWRAAYDAYSDVVQDNATPIALFQRAFCLFKYQGSTELVSRLVSEAIAADPNSSRPLRLAADVADAKGNLSEALQIYECCVEIEPDVITNYAVGMRLAWQLENKAAADRLVANVPATLAGTVSFKARVDLMRFQIDRDIESGLRLIESLDQAVDEMVDMLAIINFLSFAKRFDQMLSFTKRAILRFSDEPHIVRAHLIAVHYCRGKRDYEDAKATLIVNRSDDWIADALSNLRAPWLTDFEAKLRIDKAFERNEEDAAKSGEILALAVNGGPSVQGYLAERFAASNSAPARLVGELLGSTVSDRRRIAHASLAETTWSEYEASHASLVSKRGNFEHLEGLPEALQNAIALTARAQRMFRRGSDFSAESYFAASSFAAWVVSRAHLRAPTSVIRISDGEARFLPYRREDSHFREADLEEIQTIWWGEVRIAGGRAEEFQTMFERAVSNADAIGAPPIRRFVKLSSNAPHSGEWRALCNALRFLTTLSAPGLADRVLTSCHIHTDLEHWDLYPQILRAATSVSVISCHDLSEVILTKFGVNIRAQYLIPPEHAFAGMFGDGKGKFDEAFYPNIFDRVMRDIEPERGELVLIAAGFLGKLLCERVRERGGIGFDVGSVVDVWAGHATREYEGTSLHFDLASSLIADQPFIDDFSRRASRGTERCFSDDTRRRDIAAYLPAERLRSNLGVPRKLRVVGHPRCGSQYVSRVFIALGCNVGHERLETDGLCSWINAVEDCNPPFGAPVAFASDFAATLLYVRDPETAIPSIIVEDSNGLSFAFRRFHVFRELGVDIAEYREPAARAVASYLAWTKIVERRKPLATLHVERLMEDLELAADRLAAVGVQVDWERRAAAEAIPRQVNATEERSTVPKPVLAADWRERLPAPLSEGLLKFCRRYNYV